MKELTERQEKILTLTIDHYIKSAKPVSSGFLAKQRELEVCPATVRGDFCALTKKGFLEKPYISGGRIPTDKGYRFFVDGLLKKQSRWRKREHYLFRRIFSRKKHPWEIAEELAKVLAEMSCTLSIVAFSNIKMIWKEGWRELMSEPEFQDVDYFREFLDLVMDFEQNLETLVQEISGIQIFIGQESPLPEKGFSLMVARPRFYKKLVPTVALLGPKRMNFQRNLQVIEALFRAIETL